MRIRGVWIRIAGPLAAALLLGCQAAHIPNPNDPADVGMLSGEKLRNNYRSITDSFSERLGKNEINDGQFRALVAHAADDLSTGVDPSKVNPTEAWMYGEVLRNAPHHLPEAEAVLKLAVKVARETKNEDRRVNDSLRLAQVEAREGKVAEAIADARSVFDARPTDTAPILPAVLYELAPVARGKGQDAALAKLLEDAAEIHAHTQVDTHSEPGRAFLIARHAHIRRAFQAAETLYRAAGDEGKAAAAVTRGNQLMDSLSQMRGV